MPPRRGSFMSPPLLIILLSIVAFTFLFIALPSLPSAASRMRPASLNKTWWDSLSVFLVLFAILCGVFGRRNDDESSPPDQETFPTLLPSYHDAYVRTTEEGGGYVSHQWLGFSDNPPVSPIRVQSPATGVSLLRRSSSSYPDLRQDSSWETGTDPSEFRYWADFEIHEYQSPATDQLPVDHRTRLAGVEEEDNVKEIPVDTFEIRSSLPPAPKSPPPPPAAAHRKPRRTYQTAPRKERVDNGSEVTELHDDGFTRSRSPPPPPPESVKVRSEHKHGKSERRKGNVKREIEMVWASVLSNQKKRKKKKQRTLTAHNHSSSELPNNSRAPPPPPPPPPPSSVFHSLFKKGLGKTKKVRSAATPPPPPPPPPLASSKRCSKRTSQVPSQTPPAEPLRRKIAGRPPLPTKGSNCKDGAVNTGNQSALIPPPPFKLQEMKFLVRGDFVGIRSNHSSRCGSPEREDVDVSSTTEVPETTTKTNPVMHNGNGDGGGSVFCASPDVNVKAATFIARLKGEWKLEKLNSMKERRQFQALTQAHY